MPGTITTTEEFPGDEPEGRIKTEVILRIKAGAIKSKHKKEGDKWIITTEWNVIGENA